MTDRAGIFAGDNPIDLFKSWLSEAEKTEINDPNAIALATVDTKSCPNVRIVLLKRIEEDAFIFFTNYQSKKGEELLARGTGAFVIHWKTLQRQIRVRGVIEKEDGLIADEYYASRSLGSRIGAWASEQSRPLERKEILEQRFTQFETDLGSEPSRPPFWGGFRLIPSEIEFWADGSFRLHDRFKWSRTGANSAWSIERLNP